jgi:putative endonuclease
MSKQHHLGKKGEEWARIFLIEKGHEILETNYSFQRAEVDIISKKDNRVVFSEVKTRFGEALESITHAVSKKKQKQIIKAAHHFVQDNNIDEEARFDILWIIAYPNNKTVEHIEDAFYPTL